MSLGRGKPRAAMPGARGISLEVGGLLSVVSTLVFSSCDLVCGVWLLWLVEQLPRRLGPRWHYLSAPVRWIWAGLVLCGAVTAIVLGVVALSIYVSRGLDSAIEAGLCARMGTYTALVTYCLQRWGERRVLRRRRVPAMRTPVSGTDGEKGA